MWKLLKTAIRVILVVGIVLGLWRVLGQGAGITDPQFFPNSVETVNKFFAWLNGLFP